MKRIPFNAIWRAMMRLPGIAAEHAFFFTLLLIAVAGIFSLLLFYLYGFSSQAKQVQQEASLYDFKDELFQDTIQILDKRAQNLEDAKKETFKDVFNPTVD